MKTQSQEPSRGFTIIEILIVIIIIGLISGALAVPAFILLDNASMSTEATALAALQQDIQNSFGATNQAVNISMLNGYTGVTNPTLFDPDTNISSVMGSAITINSQNDWRMKEAAIRGMGFGV